MRWGWVERVLGKATPEEPPEDAEVRLLVEQARAEWEAACVLFAEAAKPELVDHAVHRMLAAEKRFNYLLREPRKQGVQADALS